MCEVWQDTRCLYELYEPFSYMYKDEALGIEEVTDKIKKRRK